MDPVQFKVNDKDAAWSAAEISFMQVVELALGGDAFQKTGETYTVTYKLDADAADQPFKAGEIRPVQAGMVFTVTGGA